MTLKRLLSLFLVGMLLLACSPHFVPPGNTTAEAGLEDTLFVSFDGAELPLKTWLPSSPPRAVIVALHGYNDYSNFIKDAAVWFTEKGFGVYAYDQRGFGSAPHRGMWSGIQAMCEDLRTIVNLVKKRHPGVPLFLLGDSMGGAVVMAADSRGTPLSCDGAILVAPAVWSPKTMPFYQRWLLWLAVRIMPWAELSSDGLDITASDNKEMLRELGRDPLVIKKSRVDAVYGLTNLMDAAYEAGSSFNQKVLFLYGAKDEIIPPTPMADVFRQRLQGKFAEPQRLLVYANGYHMLLRDLQAEVVWQDILLWLNAPTEPFPSVREKAAMEIKTKDDIKVALFQHLDS